MGAVLQHDGVDQKWLRLETTQSMEKREALKRRRVGTHSRIARIRFFNSVSECLTATWNSSTHRHAASTQVFSSPSRLAKRHGDAAEADTVAVIAQSLSNTSGSKISALETAVCRKSGPDIQLPCAIAFR